MEKANFKKKIEDIKNSLNTDDIVSLVRDGLGGGEPKFDSFGNPIFQTIDHNEPGEGSYKLYYYVDSQCFVSYTGDGEPMDVFELVQKAQHLDKFYDAYVYVCDFFRIGRTTFRGFDEPELGEESKNLTDDWDILNKICDYSAEPEESPEPRFVPEELLSLYTDKIVPQQWLDDGILPETMRVYGIKVDLGGRKIIIPHRDIDGNLVGIRARSYEEHELEVGMKYAPVWIDGVCYRHELGKHLYGLNLCKENVKKLGKICIAESEKSAMLGHSFYGDNNFTVATCGSSRLSQSQIDLLLELGVKEIIIAYDRENDVDRNSEQTQAYKQKLLKIAQPLTTYFDTYIVFDDEGVLDYKDSPFDKGKEVLEQLMKKKIFVPCVSDPSLKRRITTKK